MNFTTELIITGYKVEYVDLREPKPRQHHITIAAYNSDTVSAVNKLGIGMQEYITDHFSKGGYFVLDMEKLHKAVKTIDLRELYQS